MLPPRRLLGDVRQFASVRRIVLEDGQERGVRALAFSTGGGLDFWVLSDRSFDIGPLWWRGMERGFSGMLVTCGLEHVRAPDGASPLHGRLPFTPGRLLAYGEEWDAPGPHLFCKGEMVQYRIGGEGLLLTRRITTPIGGTELRVDDVVENIGPEPQPIEMLYHVNPGFPLVDEGTTVMLDGTCISGRCSRPSPASGRRIGAACTARTPP